MTSDLFTINLLCFLLLTYSAFITHILFKGHRIKFYVFLFIITGLILRLIYVSYTNYDVRNPDMTGHIDYIIHIMKFGLPKPKDCWECWQPPLYYVTSAFVSKIFALAGFTRDNEFLRMLQYWSIFINLNFLFVGLKLIKSILKDQKQFLFASALFIVWPTGVMYASRINNDSLFYLLFTLSLYLLIKWWNNNKFITIIFSSLTAILCLLTKTNGVIIIIAIIISIIARFFLRDYKSMSIIRFSIIFLIFVIGISINQRNVLMGENQDHWLLGNSNSLWSELRVENNISNFTLFDIYSYLRNPEVDSFSTLKSRQYFWNYLLRSSLFGEFYINNIGQKILAQALSPLLLVLLLFFFLRLVKLSKEYIKKQFALLITPCISIVLLLLLRFRFPYVCEGDFRYIFPIVIPLIILATEGGFILPKNQFLKQCYCFSTALFIIISIFYPLAPLLIYK